MVTTKRVFTRYWLLICEVGKCTLGRTSQQLTARTNSSQHWQTNVSNHWRVYCSNRLRSSCIVSENINWLPCWRYRKSTNGLVVMQKSWGPVNDTVNFPMGHITLSGNAQGSWRWNTTPQDENSRNLQQHFIANKEFRTKAYSIATAVALVPGDGAIVDGLLLIPAIIN